MDTLEKQHGIAVVATFVLALGAGLKRGPPGSPAFFAAAFDVFREQEARIWTLPADPDEWLRQKEAETYRDLLARPEYLKQLLLEALAWGRSLR